MSNKRLNALITIGGTITSSLKSALGDATGRMKGLGDAIKKVEDRQKSLNGVIKEQERLGRAGSALKVQFARQELADTEKQIGALRRKLELEKRVQRVVTGARELGGKMKSAGMAMSGYGLAIGFPIMKSIGEAKSYQTELARIHALGLGEEVSKDAEKFARGLNVLGTSKLENLGIVKDAITVFGDLHHAEMVAPMMARMKFGNAAMYGEEKAADNERKFLDMLKVIELRGGLASKEAFGNQANMVQRVLTATGGRVGPEEWRHLIATGGLAAKSMRDDAFYYQLEPLVQEMGGDRVGTGLMSAYSSLYQGRLTKRAANNLNKLGLIADQSKVKHDKSGQISFMDPGALKGADLFRQSQYEWMKQVLLPTLAEKGLTTRDQVLDAIGSIVSNRKGADLMAAMYLQSQQIEKNEKLNRGAYDINQLNEQGRETTRGKELIAEKKLEDLKLEMGNKVIPLYTKALETLGSVFDNVNGFMERFPVLSTVIIDSLAVMAGVLTVGGPLLLGLAAIPLAAPGVVALGGALLTAGKAVLFLGRAMLLNPIGATITAIAVGAFLVYKYWEPIMDWFGKQIDWLGEKWRAFKAFLGIGGNDATAGSTSPSRPGVPSLPSIAAPGGAGAAITNSNTFNITQLPGESADDLARRVAQKIAQQNAVRGRSAMYDPVMSHGASGAW